MMTIILRVSSILLSHVVLIKSKISNVISTVKFSICIFPCALVAGEVVQVGLDMRGGEVVQVILIVRGGGRKKNRNIFSQFLASEKLDIISIPF